MILGEELDITVNCDQLGGSELCLSSMARRWGRGCHVDRKWGGGHMQYAVCASIDCSSPRRTVQCMYSVHGQHRVLSKQ